MPYRFEVPRPFKDSEQDYLEFEDNVPIDEAISAADKYHTKQFFNEGLHMAIGALIKDRINSEDFISGLGDKLGDTMETLNLAVNGKNKYTDPTSADFNPEYNKSQEDAVNEAISLVGLGGRGMGAEGGAGTAGMFIGKKAIGPNMIKKFESAEATGKGKSSLWNEFGLYRGPEGLVRGEISDDKAEINKLAQQYIEANPNQDLEYNLGDVLDHKTLYGFYPELKDLGVKIKIDPNKRGGHYNPNDGTIEVTARNMDEAKSVLLHEVQHSIQDIEGFSFGGSPEMIQKKVDLIKSKTFDVEMGFIKDAENTIGPFDHTKYKGKNLKEKRNEWYKTAVETNPKLKNKLDVITQGNEVRQKLEKVLNEPDGDYKLYRSLYGEIEAVNTQARRFFTQSERSDFPPWLSEQEPSAGMTIVNGYRK